MTGAAPQLHHLAPKRRSVVDSKHKQSGVNGLHIFRLAEDLHLWANPTLEEAASFYCPQPSTKNKQLNKHQGSSMAFKEILGKKTTCPTPHVGVVLVTVIATVVTNS